MPSTKSTRKKMMYQCEYEGGEKSLIKIPLLWKKMTSLLFFLYRQTRRARTCKTMTLSQCGTGGKFLELCRMLVMMMVSSRLATIRVKLMEKNTSGGESKMKHSKSPIIFKQAHSTLFSKAT